MTSFADNNEVFSLFPFFFFIFVFFLQFCKHSNAHSQTRY